MIFLDINSFLGLFLILVYQILRVYLYILLIYILLTWTPLVRTKFFYYLSRITNPYLGAFQGKLVFKNMDFGPLFAIIMLEIVLFIIEKALVL